MMTLPWLNMCSILGLEIDRCRQHVVTKSGTVWSHDDSVMAEHVLYTRAVNAGTQNILSSSERMMS